MPEPSSAPSTPDPTWAPRARTVEELRARFREGAVQQGYVAPGAVDRQGRRLTDFDLDEQKERQRMPEPMPTAWLSPVRPQPPSALLRHVSGGLLGLTLGLTIAVPTVLWHKGRLDPLAFVGLTASDLGMAIAAPTMTTSVRAREPVVEAPRAATVTVPVDVVRPSAPPVVASIPETPPVRGNQTASSMVVLQPPPVEVVPPKPEPPRSEVMLDDARRLIGEGDFSAARVMLQDQALVTIPKARFLLAETYDPNFLAARGIRSVRAEVPRAIELYREALDGGIDAARQRLSALRP